MKDVDRLKRPLPTKRDIATIAAKRHAPRRWKFEKPFRSIAVIN